MIVQELVTKLGFKTDSHKLNKFNSVIGATKTGLFALAAVGTAVATGLGAMVNSASKWADELAKTSQTVGVNVEALQKLRYAAKLSNMSQEEVNTALMRFSRTIEEAKNGNKLYAEALYKAGLRTSDLYDKSLSAEDLIAKISDTFASMPDGVTKTALAMEMFGRSGARMIPMLNQGSKGIKAMYAEAEKLGLIIDEKTVKSAESFRDSLSTIGLVLDTVKNKIGLALMPKVEELTKGFLSWYQLNEQLVNSNLLTFIDAVIVSAKVLAAVLKGIMWATEKIGGGIGWLLNKINVPALHEVHAVERNYSRVPSKNTSGSSNVVNNFEIKLPNTDNPQHFSKVLEDNLDKYFSEVYAGGR